MGSWCWYWVLVGVILPVIVLGVVIHLVVVQLEDGVGVDDVEVEDEE